MTNCCSSRSLHIAQLWQVTCQRYVVEHGTRGCLQGAACPKLAVETVDRQSSAVFVFDHFVGLYSYFLYFFIHLFILFTLFAYVLIYIVYFFIYLFICLLICLFCFFLYLCILFISSFIYLFIYSFVSRALCRILSCANSMFSPCISCSTGADSD